MRSRQNGFTLLHTLAAICIAASLSGMAWSTYRHAALDAFQLEARSRLVETLLQASTQALANGKPVVVCPLGRNERCDGGSTDWSSGWMAFVDRNGNRQYDADDTRFSHIALPRRLSISTSTGRQRIVYQANGAPPGSNLTFTLCDSRGPSRATTLVMGNTGQWRHGRSSGTARCPNG